MNWNFDRKHLEIARVLVEEIKKGRAITYKKLSILVNMNLEVNSDLYHYLGDLSDYSFENGMPLISAMVVRKDSNMPGEGFYGVYEEKRGIKVGKNKEKQMDVFVKEFKKVLEYNDWDRLIELLEEQISPTPNKINIIKKKKPKLLRKLNIDKLNNEKEVKFIEIDEFKNIEDVEIEEGEYIERVIESKRRNPKVRKMKIEQFKKDNNGKVYCEVCKENDEIVLDVHHENMAVCNMEEGHLTKLSDLRILCSNCHRKVHGYKITVEELIRKS